MCAANKFYDSNCFGGFHPVMYAKKQKVQIKGSNMQDSLL